MPGMGAYIAAGIAGSLGDELVSRAKEAKEAALKAETERTGRATRARSSRSASSATYGSDPETAALRAVLDDPDATAAEHSAARRRLEEMRDAGTTASTTGRPDTWGGLSNSERVRIKDSIDEIEAAQPPTLIQMNNEVERLMREDRSLTVGTAFQKAVDAWKPKTVTEEVSTERGILNPRRYTDGATATESKQVDVWGFEYGNPGPDVTTEAPGRTTGGLGGESSGPDVTVSRTGGDLPQPTSKEEFDKIPKGSKYIDPEGNVRTKRT